jgi:hypothetical protein
LGRTWPKNNLKGSHRRGTIRKKKKKLKNHRGKYTWQAHPSAGSSQGLWKRMKKKK